MSTRTVTTQAELDKARLANVSSIALAKGSHSDIGQGMCVMEAVSYVAGEPWSDAPACACPVIAAFLRSWNDSLPDDRRNELLKPLIPRLVGTKATPTIESRRATMACDWLVRMYTPAWLRLAGLTAQADALANLPEIMDFAAGAAAGAAAGEKLAPTVAEMQASALQLVGRMIGVQA